MSVSLSAERDRIQRQVEELEQSLSVTTAELELLSSETDDGSDSEDVEDKSAELFAQREKIQKEIHNLEDVLGPHSPVCVSDADSSSDESDLGLSLSVDSCLQMNLVYQQVVQETLDQLEILLTHNHRQQKELMSQLSGPTKESSREHASYQQPIRLYLGNFLKPYFKDRLTGLGPPANQETKERISRLTGSLDHRLRVKRWEIWQKNLLLHSVSRDHLKRLIQPKLSKMDYLSQKLSSAVETDRQPLREQIDSLEKEIDLLRGRKEEELIGDRYEEHDWQKISNIDFEGTRHSEDLRCFWQNFLHPSINKGRWSQEEVQALKEVSRRHQERHWEDISEELGTGRTAFMCLQMFQRFVSDSLKRSVWTPAEDDLLRELVDKMRIGNFIPYTQMSYFMEGRDPPQLIYRWTQVLDPSLKRGPWSSAEDQLLLMAVSRFGEKNWWKIRLEVPGRSDSSCRDRYHDCLKAGTKRGSFDQQERELLLQLVKKHGVGRWAKIAAEIPQRNDAQCLRAWRRLSGCSVQKKKKHEKGGRRQGGVQKKRTSSTKKSIRRRLMVIKEEEEEEEEETETSEEEEEMVVYMDSDDEKEEEEMVYMDSDDEEYTIPPMKEWIPAAPAQSPSFLSFRPAVLPTSSAAASGPLVRSTILGKSGPLVVLGPRPTEVPWGKRHSSSAMMMVTPEQLQAHLRRLARLFNNKKLRPRRMARSSKQVLPGQAMDRGICYELQAALTPWIGNLLIPENASLTVADALRERGEQTQLSSTPPFMLLLQATNVDIRGCKEMIEQRKKKTLFMTPPAVNKRNSRTVSAILQQRKSSTEKQQDLDLQHSSILQQLQELQQRRAQQVLQRNQLQHLVLQQNLQPPPPLLQPSVPTLHPGLLLQAPQASPLSLPQNVFIPHPVSRPHPAQLIPSSSPDTFPPAPHRPPPAGGAAFLLPAPVDTPHQPPPVGGAASLLPAPLAAPHVSVVLVIQNVVPRQAVSIGSTPTNQHAAPSTTSVNVASIGPPSTIPHPSRGSRQEEVQHQNTSCWTRNEADAMMSIQTQSPAVLPSPPQQLLPAPAHLVPLPPSVSVDSLSISPQIVTPSTEHLSLATPSSTLVHPASTSSRPLALSFIDHNYTRSSSGPAPSVWAEADSAPSGQLRGGKRQREEQQRCQEEVLADLAGTGVVKNGKRVRKLSQKAQALQEATKAKVGQDSTPHGEVPLHRVSSPSSDSSSHSDSSPHCDSSSWPAKTKRKSDRSPRVPLS